ncbi:MAPEG family protein [Pseudodonghicola flavimaris]|uniref:MAPEG family protein n=1 Tax=Pseudodonghicola flavimaris TaxID=3050036 RepID=A0ABT7F0H2_9RHOB|nr:MAPEG family protein [Pseudodonghicola flavimaris]MDK3018103.1 MAPEG family protein [Pseudodonghicola flavimaris]
MTGTGRIALTAWTAGTLWALAVVFLPLAADLPYLPAPVAVPGALLAPGLVLAAQLIAQGLGRAPAGRIAETGAMIVLGLALWPFVALSLGGWTVILLGLALALARLLAWGAGSHAGLRGAAFAASLIPSLLATVRAGWLWLG